jgi:hypothetical protein
MRTLLIMCAWIEVNSTSTTYNLTETPLGLVARVHVSGTSFASFVIDTQSSDIGLMMIPRTSNEDFRLFRIGRESEFASRNNSTILP